MSQLIISALLPVSERPQTGTVCGCEEASAAWEERSDVAGFILARLEMAAAARLLRVKRRLHTDC